jgi:pimeloyl-ACP methyl ester carboxylesterase
MATYVLVPGAWLGAWAWEDVASRLRAAGHDAVPLSLSGLAEKRDVPNSDIGLDTHVQDIVSAVEDGDLRDVILVGHSYSGIPVGQAATLIGDRLRRVVFVDSNVPTDGEAFAGIGEGLAKFETALAANDGYWAPLTAPDYAEQGLSDEAIERIVTGSTPHPGHTLTDPATLTRSLAELPVTYIKCLLDGDVPSDDVIELLKSDQWTLVEMNTGHWPMFSEPQALAQVLLDAA